MSFLVVGIGLGALAITVTPRDGQLCKLHKLG